MSIFPKRTIPGKGITIHWNYNTAHLKGTHIFPFVRIGVKSPDGKISILFEGNILALPDSTDEPIPTADSPTVYKYLNKNTPLLVLADYLSGPFKKEVLVDILSSIQSGRHYYFHYPIPENAPLGKYTLISEVHSNGKIRYSKTATDDYFFVEKIIVTAVEKKGSSFNATLFNPSPESIPVKIMECFYANKGELTTTTKVFSLPANEIHMIEFSSDKSFLLYNEEREILPLCIKNSRFPLRNQQLLFLSKKEVNEEVVYVIPKGSADSFKLNGILCDVWNESDGLSAKQENEDEKYKVAYNELLKNGLIEEMDFK